MLNRRLLRKTGGKGLYLMGVLPIALILTMLSVVVFSQIAVKARKAGQAECEKNIDAINSAIERYNAQYGAYPAALQDVTGTSRVRTPYFPDDMPKCPLGGTYIMDAQHKATCSHKFAQ